MTDDTTVDIPLDLKQAGWTLDKDRCLMFNNSYLRSSDDICFRYTSQKEGNPREELIYDNMEIFLKNILFQIITGISHEKIANAYDWKQIKNEMGKHYNFAYNLHNNIEQSIRFFWNPLNTIKNHILIFGPKPSISLIDDEIMKQIIKNNPETSRLFDVPQPKAPQQDAGSGLLNVDGMNDAEKARLADEQQKEALNKQKTNSKKTSCCTIF